MKKRINRRLEREIENNRANREAPDYDEDFDAILKELDKCAGQKIEPKEYLAIFRKEVWKSNARYDPEIS
jgi:hypothetical protein